MAARDPSPFRPATTAKEREMEPGLDPDRARRLDCWWVEMGLGEERERKDWEREREEVEVAMGREREIEKQRNESFI